MTHVCRCLSRVRSINPPMMRFTAITPLVELSHAQPARHAPHTTHHKSGRNRAADRVRWSTAGRTQNHSVARCGRGGTKDRHHNNTPRARTIQLLAIFAWTRRPAMRFPVRLQLLGEAQNLPKPKQQANEIGNVAQSTSGVCVVLHRPTAHEPSTRPAARSATPWPAKVQHQCGYQMNTNRILLYNTCCATSSPTEPNRNDV